MSDVLFIKKLIIKDIIFICERKRTTQSTTLNILKLLFL